MSEDMYIKLHVLETITNKFSVDYKIGSGGFGTVYKGMYKGKEIAVKRLHQLQGLDDREFNNEFRNLWRVDHENVIKLVGYCYELNKVFVQHDGDLIQATIMERILCFEYMQGGTLDEHITDDFCDLDWATCYQIIKGTCEGINHLHNAYERPIFHLDLKPANILLDENKKAKIADLGLSRLVASTQTYETQRTQGTLGYMPPEYVDSRSVSKKFDVFSLGVIIIKLMDGNMGRARCSEMGTQNFIEHVCGSWNRRLQQMPGHPLHEMQSLRVQKCVEIALRCMVAQRDQRPFIKDVVSELEQLEAEIKNMLLTTEMKSLLLTPDESKYVAVQGLPAEASSSSSGNLCSLPVPDKVPGSRLARDPLDVVVVYAFDCTNSTPAWYTVDDIFWMVQENLAHFADSSIGFIYVMLTGNTYTCDMKPVDPAENKATGYKRFARRRLTCTKNMASGPTEANKMVSRRGYQNGIILFFSDGLINRGDFFDGTENIYSKVPVHTFTLGGDANNQRLLEIAAYSPGGKFHSAPVPERPNLSLPFSKLLDSILGGTTLDYAKPLKSSSAREPLDVVIVYAFDCTDYTPAWYTVDDGVFWMVQEKLTHYADSCLGYIYVMSTPKTYTCDMKPVDSADTKARGYTSFAWRRLTCTKNMASGLAEAHKMISSRGHQNGIILFFSDGLINRGDFFDGTENFNSKVPVHTFTLGGDAYNLQGLQAIAENSPGGTFNPHPVPEIPQQSASFSKLLDRILSSNTRD